MHRGTFDLTDESINLPPGVFMGHIAETGVDAFRVRVMTLGDRWRIM